MFQMLLEWRRVLFLSNLFLLVLLKLAPPCAPWVYLKWFSVLVVYSQDNIQLPLVLAKVFVSQPAYWIGEAAAAPAEMRAPRACSGAFHAGVSSIVLNRLPCRPCAAPFICVGCWWLDGANGSLSDSRCSRWHAGGVCPSTVIPAVGRVSQLQLGTATPPVSLLRGSSYLLQNAALWERVVGAFWGGKHQTLDFTCCCSSGLHWPSLEHAFLILILF